MGVMSLGACVRIIMPRQSLTSLESYRVVAQYKNNELAPFLPNMLFPMAKRYNNAHILVEINDIGQEVADILQNRWSMKIFWSLRCEAERTGHDGISAPRKHSVVFE